MRLGLLILRSLLLIAILVAGTLPAGMMRVAADHGPGMRLVLCTDTGPQEVWMAQDGTVTPVKDEIPQDEAPTHGTPHCVQVSYFSPDWSHPEPAPKTLRLWPANQPSGLARQVAQPRFIRPHPSRAPPLSA